jgi:glycosyltransferase involved in cell wall biosynthesis
MVRPKPSVHRISATTNMSMHADIVPPVFSLVVPTCGRVAEVDRLLMSVRDQESPERGPATVEVFVMDQNDDHRLTDVLERYRGSLTVKHIQCCFRNCSRAKNLGMAAAGGKWVLFPDDDCWFPPSFFSETLFKLGGIPDGTALFVRAYDPRLRADLIRYPKQDVAIGARNREKAFLGLQIGQIYPATTIRDIGFDESIGPGEARWPGGEETDLALRFLDTGNTIVFTPELMVFHDLVDDRSMSIDKVRRYAIGFGAICRKNGLIGHCWFKVAKQAVASVAFALLGQPRRAWAAANTAVYRARGFFQYARDV